MSVGFGFSVGDFLAGLNLVGTVIDALRESSHPSSAFRELINELYALETALLHVKHLELHESQHFEKVALMQAASQCQRTIDAFWNKVQKYQPHLTRGGTHSRVKDGWMKIKWAVCKTDDVDTFRAEIRAHTSSIGVLLSAIQLNATSMHARNQETQHRSLTGRIQEFALQAMSKLSVIADSVAQCVQHGKSLLESSAKVLQTNLQVFETIRDIQLFIKQIPTQVQYHQPVYMTDAFNKERRFYLDFITSAEAFLAVLKINFKESGCGPGMIDRGEFVIEESGTQNVVDITKRWDAVFYPGQRIAMSMVFKERGDMFSRFSCPRCGASHDGYIDGEVICSCCGAVFRRIKQLEDTLQQATLSEHHLDDNTDEDSEQPMSRLLHGDSAILKFRRLRILTTPTLQIQQLTRRLDPRHRDIKPPNFLLYSNKVYLADFGMAWDWRAFAEYVVIPRHYYAPEAVFWGKEM